MKRPYTAAEKMRIRRILSEAGSPLTFRQIEIEESNGHSMWGASGWAQKITCAGSALAEVGLPDNSGYDAAEGTVAHKIAECVLRGQWSTEDDTLGFAGRMTGTKITVGPHVVTIDDTMQEYVQQYVNWCREAPGIEFIEQFVDLSPWTPIPNQGGTADYGKITIDPETWLAHLTITDLKYGMGVQVYAAENPQLAGYALGFINEWKWLFDFDRVTIRICQPRLGHFDVWETDVEHLYRFGLDIKARLALGLRADATRTPSEKGCKFCKAISRCPAVVAVAERLADNTFDDETVTAAQMIEAPAKLPAVKMQVVPAALSTAQLVRFLDYQKLFEKAFTEVYNELQRRVMAGEDVPEWFMAKGRKTRTIPPAARRKVLYACSQMGLDPCALYKTEFLTPAAIEELLVKEAKLRKKDAVAILKPFVQETDGPVTLARRKTGRVAAQDLSLESFEDVTSDL